MEGNIETWNLVSIYLPFFTAYLPIGVLEPVPEEGCCQCPHCGRRFIPEKSTAGPDEKGQACPLCQLVTTMLKAGNSSFKRGGENSTSDGRTSPPRAGVGTSSVRNGDSPLRKSPPAAKASEAVPKSRASDHGHLDKPAGRGKGKTKHHRR